MPFDGVQYTSNRSLQKIDAVIDLLGTPEKWCKGALRSHDGRYCIRGAVRALDAAEVLEPAILQAIGDVAGRRFHRIESFNDHPATTHDEVITVLRRARERIRIGDTIPLGGGGGNGRGRRANGWRNMMIRWLAP